MTRGEALKELGLKLTLLPDTYQCVVCGFSKVIEWEVTDDREDENDHALRIGPSGLALAGWCTFGGDHTFKGVRGLHCPECYAKASKK